MFGLSPRRVRCAIYAIFAVLVAIEPLMSIGPLLFLLAVDAIEDR